VFPSPAFVQNPTDKSLLVNLFIFTLNFIFWNKSIGVFLTKVNQLEEAPIRVSLADDSPTGFRS
jgi:hypothetical protein